MDTRRIEGADAMKLADNHYGKSRVRVARLVRHKDHHELHEMTVAIALEGDFEASYAEGDNRKVLPTDTMKNTVYALAKDAAVEQPESFALLLGRHFVKENPQVACARVEAAAQTWQRHGRFSFVAGGGQRRVAQVAVTRGGSSVEAGVTGLVLLRTAGSAFDGYVKDRLTTLKETRDRIFCTSLDARWKYAGGDAEWDDFSWNASWHGVMKLLTDTFAEHESESVQHTMHAMAEAVLAQCDPIEEIRMSMPNKHYLPVNLEPFGLDAANEVFCPTDEPHGLIEAVFHR
jgi:urate oxidase